jgi:hypothetical protein
MVPRKLWSAWFRPAALACGCCALVLVTTPALHSQERPDSAAFVTRLGVDTIAVERFVRTPTMVTAEVVLRVPRTTLQRYTLELDTRGEMRRYESYVYEAAAGMASTPVRHDVVTVRGDSTTVAITRQGETQTRTVAGGGEMLPFIDMVHWPFELMLTRARGSAGDSVSQPLLSGTRRLAFVVRRLSDDSMTVRHPSRGMMRTRVDARGRLLGLNASGTTRKLVVTREPWIDVEGYARDYAARDAAGRSFGVLSGRGGAQALVQGASITVDYGTPSKRGRRIFGTLVPWNEVWRTGANRATHFTTDRDLIVGGLEVPAGEYTLYTIPAPAGGQLIINRQTGQGGTTYNQDRDLGRVEMTVSALPSTVELFTILVEEHGAGGVIKLQWDRTEFAVPFEVRERDH